MVLVDYMEDMFEELGPTKFIRGSHVAGRRPAGANHYKGMPAQSLMVKGGDCVMFRCGPSYSILAKLELLEIRRRRAHVHLGEARA